MPFKERNTTYWDNKFLSYMHDPFDKMLDIKTHEERAKQIIEQFGIQIPNGYEELWRRADGIASGFERGVFPDRHHEENKDGSVDFTTFPTLTHPIQGGVLSIDLSQYSWNGDTLKNKIAEIIGTKAGGGGYSSRFANQYEQFVKARFIYAHLGLRFKLANDNVAGLGCLWHKIPADSRIPDHSIWHHNALVSALVSCMNPDGTPITGDAKVDNKTDNIGLMIFTITPVQSFISKARKLRDYWTGSVLLSYLAFEGIRWVIEHLGPDHILYPSLLDQPLIIEYLKKEWHIEENLLPTIQTVTDIATFPNKVMLLVPLNEAKEIGEAIENSIKQSWKNLSKEMALYVKDKVTLNEKTFNTMFTQQNETYWDVSWVVNPLLNNNNIGIYKNKKLLNLNVVKTVEEQIETFAKITNYRQQIGKYYPLSNILAQSALGNLKLSQRNIRNPENGKKCTLCGELESLTDRPYNGTEAAHEYKAGMDSFWERVRKAFGKESGELQEGEQLCSICLTKRLLARMFNEEKYAKGHILTNTFSNYQSFPSTSYIALHNYYEREHITAVENQRELAQKLYDQKDEQNVSGFNPIKIRDRYYAILIMDGDNMGKLISGNTIEATWGTVIHPIIKERMGKPSFEVKYRENWKNLYDKKRLITPALHAAISEALGDFALYGVPSIINNHGGRLIYAGGDDVCAILPIDTAIQAAKEIANYYTRFFSFISSDNSNEKCDAGSTIQIKPGKLCHGMGKGEKISISAGILMCHYKEPLSAMISRAHALLDTYAKDLSGRNSCAIELKKRSGGSRYFYQKWEHPCWDSFNGLLKTNQQLLSKSCIYNLDNYEVAFNTILENEKEPQVKIKQLLSSIVKKSIGSDPDPEHIKHMTDLLLIQNEKQSFSTDPLKILAFLRGESNE